MKGFLNFFGMSVGGWIGWAIGAPVSIFTAFMDSMVGTGRPEQERGGTEMPRKRTRAGREVEEALGEVLAHVRGEADLPLRIVDDPSAERILALRKRMKLSRRKFADRFGLDARAVQDWEQGRRLPDRAARVLLTVIERDPKAVERALAK